MPFASTQSRSAQFRLPGPVENPVVPTEIVAEISGNHNGHLAAALCLIDAAKKSGADAVKFQCFEPEALATKRLGVVWHGALMTYEQLLGLYRKTHTPKEWYPKMIKRCAEAGIAWFASAFSRDDVTFLETINCPRYKISAYEMLDGDLISAVAATGKPIIMSVRPTDRVTILEATDYEGNVIPLGLSNHARAGNPLRIHDGRQRPMVERHIMLVDVPNEDQEFSSTPSEFAMYVDAIRGGA